MAESKVKSRPVDGYAEALIYQADRLRASIFSLEKNIQWSKGFHHRWSTPEELDHALCIMRDIAESTVVYIRARAETLEAEADARLIT